MSARRPPRPTPPRPTLCAPTSLTPPSWREQQHHFHFNLFPTLSFTHVVHGPALATHNPTLPHVRACTATARSPFTLPFTHVVHGPALATHSPTLSRVRVCTATARSPFTLSFTHAFSACTHAKQDTEGGAKSGGIRARRNTIEGVHPRRAPGSPRELRGGNHHNAWYQRRHSDSAASVAAAAAATAGSQDELTAGLWRSLGAGRVQIQTTAELDGIDGLGGAIAVVVEVVVHGVARRVAHWHHRGR
jgi:hypothetical protein